MSVRYNPCFSGSSSATRMVDDYKFVIWFVTILVFLAALVQLKRHVFPHPAVGFVTILVFLAALVQLN